MTPMRKALNEAAKSLFVEMAFERSIPLKPKKSVKGLLPGAIHLESKLDENRVGWLAFGGIGSNEFALAAGWTVSGKKPSELTVWGQHQNPRAYEPFPIPEEGCVDLRERWRFEQSSLDPYFPLTIPDPESSLQVKICDSYFQSKQFNEETLHIYNAVVVKEKTPPSFEEFLEQTRAAERILAQLWSHLLDRWQFTEDALREIVRPAVSEAIDLALLHGVPLIHERIMKK